jgi:hypothetical protein
VTFIGLHSKKTTTTKTPYFNVKAVQTGTVPAKVKSELAPEPQSKLFESQSQSWSRNK